MFFCIIFYTNPLKPLRNTKKKTSINIYFQVKTPKNINHHSSEHSRIPLEDTSPNLARDGWKFQATGPRPDASL